MDPVTHLASGVMGGIATRRYFPEAKLFIPFCMLAAWIPDVDILWPGSDPEFSLLYHRGITTSFFGGIFLALAVTILFKTVSRKTPFHRAVLLAYGLVVTHVWLDLITTYGTQILAPFSHHRFALDGAFIIDPLFTGVALLFIATSMYLKDKRTLLGTLGMAWFFLYPCANMAIGAHLQTVYAADLDTKGIPHTEVHVTPDALSPRYWKVITTSGDDYLQDTMDLFGDKDIPMRRYRRADRAELRNLGTQVSLFATYAWFVKWPYVKEQITSEGRTQVFGDLRFTSTNPVMKKIFAERHTPFTLTVHLDPEGRILQWNFVKGVSSMENPGPQQ